ncbi:MAG: DUF1127 domain-containing protein [Gammaproteobacteria bacterium]|jgi:uncharacterized protein YjiS (DUF1127 family)|nr:DUF1127 domain-containing protein [Gammaproteobacteria bacterium]
MNTYTGHPRARLDVAGRGHGVVSQLRGWLHNLGATLHRNHERRVAIRELRALSDSQLDDIGVARDEIPEIVQSLTTRKAVETRAAGKQVGSASLGAGYCIGHS